MFTVYVGRVGAGKTYAMVRAAMQAYENGETVFANIDLDTTGWKAREGSRYVRWREPFELLEPAVRCGTVLWDELGASVNNRESDFWPLALTIKLIEHRKDHLDFHATVQDDELADKNVRRFYNRVFFVSEWRVPLLGLVKSAWRRPDLPCPNEGCSKTDHLLMRGDKGPPWAATVYRAKDVHPKYTQNKQKHESRGSTFYGFDVRIASAYASSAKVASEAVAYYERLKKAARRKGSAA